MQLSSQLRSQLTLQLLHQTFAVVPLSVVVLSKNSLSTWKRAGCLVLVRERYRVPLILSRLRSGLNNLFIFSKLREARSRLYRRQILQVNIRWKALDEIYKMYILLHRSDLKISAKKVVIILVKLNK